MRASFIPDQNGKLLLWLRAESFIEYDSLAKFVEQSEGQAVISYQKDKDRVASIYVESAPISKKPDPFWRKWLNKRKSL